MRHIANRETFHSNQQAFLIFLISIFFEKRMILYLWMEIFFLDSHFSKNFKNSHCIFTTLLSSPPKTAVIFFLNKVKFPLPIMFVPSLVKVHMVVMENIFKCCQCIFPIALLFPLGFKCTRIPLTQDMWG